MKEMDDENTTELDGKIVCNDTDYVDIQNTLFEYMDEYFQENVLQMSQPNFYCQFITDITHIFYEDWLDANLCREDDYSDIEELVEEHVDIYFDINNIPARSNLNTSNSSFINVLDSKRKNINKIKAQIEHLTSIPQPKQRTPEWYTFRYNLITASNLWKALNTPSMINSLIYEKCKPLEQSENTYCNTDSPLHWGQKYEPLTTMIYEDMYKTTIGDFGCIPHPRYSFIGASPDGININVENIEKYGRMLEIKNIFNREITGIPKQEYWIQTQIQMETCDLDECDFVETCFKEYESAEAFYQETVERDYRGVILYFVQRTEGYSIDASFHKVYDNRPKYIYMPLDIPLEKDIIDEWINETIIANPDYVLFKPLYWYLNEFSCVLIKRNRLWFQAAVPKIEEVWNTILKERQEGYQHRAPKKRTKSEITVNFLGDDTEIHRVNNMPLANTMCLIKLDENGEVL